MQHNPTWHPDGFTTTLHDPTHHPGTQEVTGHSNRRISLLSRHSWDARTKSSHFEQMCPSSCSSQAGILALCTAESKCMSKCHLPHATTPLTSLCQITSTTLICTRFPLDNIYQQHLPSRSTGELSMAKLLVYPLS